MLKLCHVADDTIIIIIMGFVISFNGQQILCGTIHRL